ncbi:SLC13 family permease [Algiphilus sp.]|nr:SLC13 family permease [Pseudomonadota bacterium]
MGWQGWFVVGVIVAVLLLLASERLRAELAVLGGMVALLTAGVLSPEQALAGFSNPGMITVAAMYVVAAGLRETGAIDLASRGWLGNGGGIGRAQLKIMLPTAGLSAFINNTPVVATFLPVVSGWARRNGVSASRLLMPLSYAAIVGGMCTLVGTSTNLVVNGKWVAEGGRGLGFFELAWVGVPAAVLCILYMMTIGRRLLPERGSSEGLFDNPREYTVEMDVTGDGPLVGQTIGQAGLRHLGKVFLVEIVRDGSVLPAVSTEERLQAEDRLVFAGDVSSVLDLQRIKGLRPVREADAAIAQQFPERKLVEVVLSARCPLIGQTLRDSRFHTYYGASVVAMAREGKRLRGGLGEVRLRPADTLLLEARPAWVDRHRYSPDFLLISQHQEDPPRYERALSAWCVLAAIVASATTGMLDMLTAALLGAGAMIATGCVSVAGARKSVDLQVLLVIAGSFALGEALSATGASAVIASSALAMAGDRPWVLLALTYAITSLMTELITNNAAALLMFPIAVAAATGLGLALEPFVVTVMLAASASFASPLGYQTNLMVSGPGSYRFLDFTRVGLPLNVLIGVLTVTLVPRIWPF